MKFNLSIITPVAKILEEQVDEVIIPTASGEVGILANHAPLLSKIIPGEVTVKKGDEVNSFAITGGFLEVTSNNLTLLSDYAISSKDINLVKAQAAKERAEKLMKEKASDVDYADIEKEFVRAIAELKVARKYKPS